MKTHYLYPEGEDVTIRIEIKFSLTGFYEVVVTRSVDALTQQSLIAAIDHARSAFEKLLSPLALPEHDDDALDGDHPYITGELSAFHMDDVDLVTRKYSVESGELVYAGVSVSSKLQLISDAIIPPFLRDLAAIGITLTEAA
jgi:hypothetical protein